jgi:hypothetical protein
VVSLLYLLFRRVLSVAALRVRSREFKELEIVVLRHELAVLRRQISRPRLDERDRVFLAAAGQLLGRRSRSFFVRPDTLLGCIASLCGDGGRMRDDDRVAQRSPRRSVSSCCGSRVRTRAGASSGSSGSWPVSACASRQRRSPRSCGKRACLRPALEPSSAGATSCMPRRQDRRLRLLHGRDALARTPLRAVLPRTRQPARPCRRLHREPDGRWSVQQARQLAWSLAGRATPGPLPDPRP